VRIAKHQVDQLTNEPEDGELGAQDAETHEKSSKDKDTDPQSGDKNQDSPHDPFHWLALPLLQASTIGLDDVIAKLLSVGADPNPPKGTHLNERLPFTEQQPMGTSAPSNFSWTPVRPGPLPALRPC
jgi:hypothetical protein